MDKIHSAHGFGISSLKCYFKILSFILLGLFLAFLTSPAGAQVVAFPGAFGFGAAATGGRGGAVYHVTNLNDSGTGSFRDAVSAGNRVIVFDVGGYVVLLSAVSVSSNLSIEGQTAPGGGIGLMAAEISLSGKSNIIIRNVRFRQGNEDPDTGKSAINVGDGSNIILDHCSFEYGQFDGVDAVGVTNFTVQNCIIANPIGQQFGAHVEVGPDTFYRDLWVNAHNRQPLAKSDTQYINNIIYNFQAAYTVADTGGVFSHDIVGNYFITGPSTTSPGDAYFQFDANQSVYSAGNYMDSNKDGVLNGSPYNTIGGGVTVLSAPWSPTTSSIPTLSAAPASGCQMGLYPSVMESCGAFPRDAVDNFVIGDVSSLGLTGTIYTNQADTGLANNGYGTLAAGTPFTDTSGDGIADYWAAANGISTTNAAAGTAAYGTTGYTNLEVYVNSLVLPAPWSGADLPGTSIQGASSFNSFTNQWLLTGSGTACSSTLTEGQFASQPWTGDGTLTAELLGLTGSSSEGGLLLSGTGGAYVALAQNASGTLSLIWQGAGETAQSVQTVQTTSPLYLEITGSAGAYSGYYSTNGTTYKLLGQATVSLGTGVQAGLVLASGSSTALGTASFTNPAILLQACATPSATPTSGGASPTATPTSSRTPTASSTVTATDSATKTATWITTTTPTSTFTRTPTGTATLTSSMTPTASLTASRTNTATASATATVSSTPTPSNSATDTATFTPTATATRTNSSTATFTPTPTLSATNSPTFSATATVSLTHTATLSSTATASPTNTATGIPTATTSSTASKTMSPTDTSTDSPTATSSFSPTATPISTQTSTPSMTPSVTASYTSTATPSTTTSWTSTSSSTATASHTPSGTPTLTPTSTQPPTLTSTSTGTPSSTLTATSSATTTSSPTATQTWTPTSTSSFTSTKTPMASSTQTFTSTASATPIFTFSKTFTPSATGTSTPVNILTPTRTPTPQATIIVYPNPVTGPGPVTVQLSLGSAASEVRVEIFTLAFRKVNEITLSNVATGSTDIPVSLTDRKGTPLANGLYYVVVQTSQGRFITKLMVLR